MEGRARHTVTDRGPEPRFADNAERLQSNMEESNNSNTNNTVFNANAVSLHGSVAYYVSISIAIGYILGWAINSDSTKQLVAWIFGIILCYLIKFARKWNNEQIITYSELIRIHRNDEMTLLEKQIKNVKEQIKAKHEFTSELFDDSAKALLKPVLRKAKKEKILVSGHMLVDAFFKSIR